MTIQQQFGLPDKTIGTIIVPPIIMMKISGAKMVFIEASGQVSLL